MKYKGLGRLQKVKNSKKYKSANDTYHYVRVIDEDKNEIDLMLTEHDLATLITRATVNWEDVPEIGYWEKIKRFFR